MPQLSKLVVKKSEFYRKKIFPYCQCSQNHQRATSLVTVVEVQAYLWIAKLAPGRMLSILLAKAKQLLLLLSQCRKSNGRGQGLVSTGTVTDAKCTLFKQFKLFIFRNLFRRHQGRILPAFVLRFWLKGNKPWA